MTQLEATKTPTDTAVADALRALATAIDYSTVTVKTGPDGLTTDVNLMDSRLISSRAGVLFRRITEGLSDARSEDWIAGGLLCRDVTGILLGGRVTVHVLVGRAKPLLAGVA